VLINESKQMLAHLNDFLFQLLKLFHLSSLTVLLINESKQMLAHLNDFLFQLSKQADYQLIN